MPGRPKPTKLKLIEGNPGKRKLPKNEVDPVSCLPSPPEHLDEYAKEEWARLADGMHAIGILYAVDVATFAAYCTSYSIWRRANEERKKRIEKNGQLSGLIDVARTGGAIQNILVGISNKAAADMVMYAKEFGMTPQARARLGEVNTGSKDSKFGKLISKK